MKIMYPITEDSSRSFKFVEKQIFSAERGEGQYTQGINNLE